MGCMFETAKRNQCNEITSKDKRPKTTTTTITTKSRAHIPEAPPSAADANCLAKEFEIVDPFELQIESFSKYFPSSSLSSATSPSSSLVLSSSSTSTTSLFSSSPAADAAAAATTVVACNCSRSSEQFYNTVVISESNKKHNRHQQNQQQKHQQHHLHQQYDVGSGKVSPTAMPETTTTAAWTKCNMENYIRAGYYITSRLFNNNSISSISSSITSRRSNSLLNSRNKCYLNNKNHNSQSECSASVSGSVSQSATELAPASASVSASATTTSTISAKTSSIRNSISLYAASSVILVLCYLTSSTSATVMDHPIFDESSSDKEILDHLLQKSRYDKRLLPPVNDEDFCCGLSSPENAKNQSTMRPHHRGTLTVNVNVLLLSLASPDESSLKYEVEFLLNQQWNDPRLQYGNKSQYDYLNALHHHDNIWTPDTYFIMHGDFKDPIIPMHFALRIYRNGTITYAMRRHLILSCQGSLHIFPFDDPKCSFSMESISYELSHIKYVWKNDEDTLRKSPSLTTLNAYLIQNATVTCSVKSWRGNYSCLKVELMFTRDRAFYFTTVFIPGIILVTSSFITFWLEWNAVPARVMIGVTTMLNFFTTSNGFRSTLPVVSNLTAMNVWDGVCMCFIYASLLEFVCVNYVGRKRPLHNVVYRPGENPVTQRLPAVLSRIGVILASPLEIIEREFHAALSSEKAAAAAAEPHPSITSATRAVPVHFPTTTGLSHAQHQHLTAISVGGAGAGASSGSAIRRASSQIVVDTLTGTREPVYVETVEVYTTEASQTSSGPYMRQSRSMATNTPALIIGGRRVSPSPSPRTLTTTDNMNDNVLDVEVTESQLPVKPPRRKSSRSTTPSGVHDVEATAGQIKMTTNLGEKKRETGGPNEIVACTNCGGGSSPCTHSANNGCATEVNMTCFVQVRKKEPPHPIRVAKTIDVIARITFPTAYSIFLIFFFVHYKGFS
ncbi:uncharacterized protein LOC129942174 isoform X4 [Eupeodes corollae]|uniref:uncharacterized protein LOC129942174 isoform X4 n=1 Tax=Eupeodes corollae TaxID=290404 RepID=UPI00248FAC9C|nr:uncharacterized protein LOC129942174 isoform X4 [Eupeodes corollae]